MNVLRDVLSCSQKKVGLRACIITVGQYLTSFGTVFRLLDLINKPKDKF